MTVSITKVKPREQAAVMRWPEQLGIGIIQAYTKTKAVDFKGWPTLDFTKVDFKANLANGLYDHGIALRTGKTISGNKYLVVLDFDGWEAVIAWFGSWENVLALSKKTLVEWHQDPGKIHVFLFSSESLLSRKIHIKNAYLEIRCQNEEGVGQLVFASPSIHKEGSPYCALGTNLIEEMQPIDLLRIKSKINQLCENYMSDLDKDKYDAMLDDPAVILGVNCGRHDATLFKTKRYFFKYSEEWLDLTDEQRFERAWQWHLAHCKPPRSRKEFEEICKWIVKTLRQKRDQMHDAERLKRNNAKSRRQQQQQQQQPDASAEEAEEKKPPKPIQNYEYVQFYQEGNIFAEAVTISNSRTQRFAAVNTETKQISLFREIKIDAEWDDDGNVTKQTVYCPLGNENYVHKPYTFESEKDFYAKVNFVKNHKMCTLDAIYQTVKRVWSQFIDAEDEHLIICAADTIFTYFQDVIGLTHYLWFVGDNDSGKSNNLWVLHYLAYRNLMSLGISAANVYQFLGSGEEGIGTICEDEANQIDEDKAKMELAKSGYTKGFPVVKITISNDGQRHQKRYNTFCFKAYSAEKAPDPMKAKGMIQRLVKLRCIAGDPSVDILEVINPMGDEEMLDLLKELHGVRNLLLCYRLEHRNDKIPNVKVNLKNRERQLFKPLLRLFYGTEAMDEVQRALSKYVNERRKVKLSGINAFLIQLVQDMLQEASYNDLTISQTEIYEVPTNDIWTRVQTRTDATTIPGHPLTCETTQFGPVSHKRVIEILENIFKAEVKTSNSTRIVRFDKKVLDDVFKSYATDEVKISVTEYKLSSSSSSAITDSTLSTDSGGMSPSVDSKEESEK